MHVQYLIKGGRIVDGTGAPAYEADVRVRHGRIVEIEAGLEPQPREPGAEKFGYMTLCR